MNKKVFIAMLALCVTFLGAKNWLEDDDAELQGGEKLAAYYDKIVCGED